MVRLEFDDNTVETGSMVMGCDGSHSKIRQPLVGEGAAKLQQLDLTMINFPRSGYRPDEVEMLRSRHPISQLAYHPSGLGSVLLAALDFSDQTDPTTWRFQNYTSGWGSPYAQDLQDPVQRTAWYKKQMASFCDSFRTGGLAVKDGEEIPVYPGQQWAPTIEWDNYEGKVTIAGDAAHSMLPHRGQGLNNAVKDASDLVDAIKAAMSGQMSLKETVTTYEEEMRPCGAKEVALSLEQAEQSRQPNTWDNTPMFTIGLDRTSVPPA